MKIDVQMPGASHITQMEESDLLRLEGGFENDVMIQRWVQYHLPATGQMVHRSLDVKFKTVPGLESTAHV